MNKSSKSIPPSPVLGNLSQTKLEIKSPKPSPVLHPNGLPVPPLEGEVQLRGGKAYMAIKTLEGEDLLPLNTNAFLPGDIISKQHLSPSYTLIKRQKQITLATVKKQVGELVLLHIPFFGPACPFTPAITPINNRTCPGDRYVIALGPYGEVTPLEAFGQEAASDIPILEMIYKGQGRDKAHIDFTKQKPFYTLPGVLDHTDLHTFTIDPESSKDFDDAISIDLARNILYVHIVDIAAQEFSEEEEEQIRTRCYTGYFGDENTVHLLQEEKANHELSLVVGEPRATITCRCFIDPAEGKVLSYDIYRSTICVKERLTYAQAGDLLLHRSPKLVWLNELSKLRSKDVNYNLTLPTMYFRPDGTPFRESSTDDAHQCVATAMILCNLIVSKHLRTCGVEIPNRFHDKLQGFRMLDASEKTGDAEVDSFLLCKRYARAKYSVDEAGHFGLGLTDYVHFTSPMRRYADILIHRLLAGWDLPKDFLEAECDWMNHRQWLVKQCHFQQKAWKMVRWVLAQPADKSYTAWITDVKAAGVLWFIPELNLNGFAFVGYLHPPQRWVLKGDELVGSNNSDVSQVQWKLGNRVKAFGPSVDRVTGVISFKLIKY